jgi:hypothetical protein
MDICALFTLISLDINLYGKHMSSPCKGQNPHSFSDKFKRTVLRVAREAFSRIKIRDRLSFTVILISTKLLKK